MTIPSEPIDIDQSRWVRESLAKLREKLIDLSKRNLLVSFKHSERGASHLRFVDERPNHLFASLRTDSMTFEPLPGADEIPQDENTSEFQIALERARLTDELYLKELELLGDDIEDTPKLEAAERNLRARVREALRLPKLPTAKLIDVAALARLHGFDPSYELGPDSDDSDVAHHRDDKIRVLFTEDRLEKRLKTIHDRYRSHAAETGLHTLYVVFGFVEWFEDETSEFPLHAPVLVCAPWSDPPLMRATASRRIIWEPSVTSRRRLLPSCAR